MGVYQERKTMVKNGRKKKPSRARTASNGAGEKLFGLWEGTVLHIGGRMGYLISATQQLHRATDEIRFSNGHTVKLENAEDLR